METHIEGSVYGDIYKVQCMETFIEVTIYGD